MALMVGLRFSCLCLRPRKYHHHFFVTFGAAKRWKKEEMRLGMTIDIFSFDVGRGIN
jgi:hypothetical protein